MNNKSEFYDLNLVKSLYLQSELPNFVQNYEKSGYLKNNYRYFNNRSADY